LNKREEAQTKSDFERDKSREKFSSLTIEEAQLNLGKNDNEWSSTLSVIKQMTAQLPILEKEVPRLWKRLREALEQEKQEHNYINISRYQEICTEDIKLTAEEDQLQALDYFNKIGIVSYFATDENLRTIVFLNPNWITQGIYAAISAENENMKSGWFTKTWIDEFWKAHPNKYTFNDRSLLLRLMLKDNFDICYPSPDSNTYIVPMLLPDKLGVTGFESEMKFLYRYPYMPKGIVARLIVRLNEYIEGDLRCKTGVVFWDKKTGCRAKVEQDVDPTSGLKLLSIELKGGTIDQRKEFLGKIREQVDYIKKSAFRALNYDEMVICNCEVCTSLKAQYPNSDKEEQRPFQFALKTLSKYANAGTNTIECQRKMGPVSISELMGTVYPQNQIEQKLRAMESNTPPTTPTPTPSKADDKRKNVITGAIIAIVIFMLVGGFVFLFISLEINILWFISSILFILLLFPSIWSFAMTETDKDSLTGFSKVMDKLNVFKPFTSSKKK
ncbi:MAG: hypothetical protein F6K17_09510, partial [Okeania sp. SIO3C4]|nr:hypothetical protein [Okeania sp. SIO3C4]